MNADERGWNQNVLSAFIGGPYGFLALEGNANFGEGRLSSLPQRHRCFQAHTLRNSTRSRNCSADLLVMRRMSLRS